MTKEQIEQFGTTSGPLGDYCREILSVLDELKCAKAKLIELFRKNGIDLPDKIKIRDIACHVPELEKKLAKQQGVELWDF